MPNPIVTAEVPSGSVKPRSKRERTPRLPCTICREVRIPIARAMQVATVAKTSELRIALSAVAGS